MKWNSTTSLPFLALLFALAMAAAGQDPRLPAEQEAAYTRTLTRRADKIVATLGISDTAAATRVREIIIQQYRELSRIHDARDLQIKSAQARHLADKAAGAAETKSAQDRARTRLTLLHADYLAKLAQELTPEQVNLVKDGMTYGVVQVTYYGYLKLLPDLTDAQKQQIKAWLTEARELAMDEGTAEDKHKVFGKYKGKINNYLAAAGYHLKAAEKKLQAANPPVAGAQAQ